ncbi:MAG: integrin alpha, partial [Aeoliella sp.]
MRFSSLHSWRQSNSSRKTRRGTKNRRKAQHRERGRFARVEQLEDRRVLSFTSPLELSSLLPENGGDGSTGFVINGIDAGDRSGQSVSGAGDFNGDGVKDVIVGAYSADPNGVDSAGESYVVFGSATGLSATLDLST